MSETLPLHHVNRPYPWASRRRLTAAPLGEGRYFVSGGNADITRGHNASVTWGPKTRPKFECTCGFPQKMQLPCSHVLAAVKGEIGDKA